MFIRCVRYTVDIEIKKNGGKISYFQFTENLCQHHCDFVLLADADPDLETEMKIQFSF